MNPHPQDEAEDRNEPGETPLEDGDAGRHVAHLTGMTPESAATFAAYHSGRMAPFHRAA